MVPVRVDFYRLREEVRQAIAQQIKRLLDKEWDPFEASWLAYALSQEGFEGNQLLQALLDRLERWAKEDGTRAVQRSIGPLCFLAYFLFKNNKNEPDLETIVLNKIEELCQGINHKFSPVNDPEQMFPVALLVGTSGKEPHRDTVVKAIQARLNGTLKRRILYAASLRELSKTVSIVTQGDEPNDPGSIIAMVWFCERYEGEREKWWKSFESIRETVSLNSVENVESSYVLSAAEIAMLYESLVRETNNPEPKLLFELYPLHPLIKNGEIVRKLFREANYVHAVFEAFKLFENYIRQLTGLDKEARSIVQESMRKESPKIKFNSLQGNSERNEQEGLKLISEGICAAIRNPKAHEPSFAPTVQIDAYEALDQLVTISYILKRIDRAEVVPPPVQANENGSKHSEENTT